MISFYADLKPQTKEYSPSIVDSMTMTTELSILSMLRLLLMFSVRPKLHRFHVVSSGIPEVTDCTRFKQASKLFKLITIVFYVITVRSGLLTIITRKPS